MDSKNAPDTEQIYDKMFSIIDDTMEQLTTDMLPDALPELYFPTVEEVKYSLAAVPKHELYPLFVFFASDPYAGKLDDEEQAEYRKLVRYSTECLSELVDFLVENY